MLIHIPLLVVLSLVVLSAQWMGWLQGFETFALDGFIWGRSDTSGAKIFLIVIDDRDYKTIFGGRSPLDGKELQAIVNEVAACGPAVIGVDIDTSDPTFARLCWPEAVWYRPARLMRQDALDGTHESDAEGEEIIRESALGGGLHDAPPDSMGVIETTPESGVGVFFSDRDGVVREYRRLVFSPESDPPSPHRGYAKTLPWAIARKFQERLKKRAPPNGKEAKEAPANQTSDLESAASDGSLSADELSEPVVMNFSGAHQGFTKLPVWAFREAAANKDSKDKSPLKDAIVLIGGTFSAARDVWSTPVGPRYGVELIAQAVETEILDNGIHEFDHRLGQALEFIVGLVYLYVAWRFPSRMSFYGGLALIAVLAFVASLIAFHVLAYWFNFVPVLFLQWMHLQWEQVHQGRELRHELEALRRELAVVRPSQTSPGSQEGKP